DFLLLVGSALLLIALGAGSFALRDEYHFGEFWLWGGWIGVGTFASVAGFLRSKFRQRGFTVFCVVWFPVHMAVALGAAARYPILISLLPVTVELWVGFTIAFWLFALPPKGGE
ncbi:MAG: hypothetical protein DMG22_02755, partial [Acidobacteria bacterium]